MKETQNIEWKLSWHDDYLKCLSGFANAQGGTLFIRRRWFFGMKVSCLSIGQ